MKDSKGKLITHAVVIIKEPPSQILIFDPYKPFRPEIFDISDKQERLTFLSWVFRSYYQYRLGDKSGKNVILSLAQQELSQPKWLKKSNKYVWIFTSKNSLPRSKYLNLSDLIIDRSLNFELLPV